MKRAIQSVLRIVVTVVTVVALLVLALAWVLRQPTLGSVGFPGDLHADPAVLRAHVEFLASPEHPRDWRNPSNLDRAAAYVAQVFARTSARCSEQPFRAETLQTKNVLAAFGPTTGPRIVVGAHYDVCGPHPGADDNASGVAGILELARLLDRVNLSTPVELVAYSTEEPPYFGSKSMGSAVHADSLLRSTTPVRAMISLEMIGYFTPSQPSRGMLLLQLLYPRNGNFIACVGRWADRDLVREAKKCFRAATQVQAVSYSGPVSLGSDLSDHRNYWAAGFPALMVTDTGPIRNLNYHCPTDTADSLDYSRMAGVVDGVFSTVVHLANDQ